MGALCLTRKIGESIMIGDDIEILITEIKSSAVRISIKAPRDLVVDRREVFDRKRAESAELAK